ncbi:hypothetical protein EXIGLDRAFT_677875 [Exidia glandulosa HHB12029]|uniref:Uncharacterized protein n=1 Tax=Exidia glandulosa HHB12029 TaxID=1314781 RepID=A0A165FW59_EXIGL|nr:hypothetical protein EXIGLDRAFT_677875 [Exidia glandulosa HHB12029]
MPITSKNGLLLLYGGNALWFTSAFTHFVFYPERTLRRVTSKSYKASAAGATRNLLAEDVLRYLGAFNASALVLALLRVIRLLQLRKQAGVSVSDVLAERQLDVLALAVLGVANLSQCISNLGYARQTGRWIMGHGFDRITVLDTVFAILDFGAVLRIMA